MLAVILIIWILFIAVAVYVYRLRRMRLIELVAYCVALVSVSFMLIAGRSALGYVGAWMFIVVVLAYLTEKLTARL